MATIAELEAVRARLLAERERVVREAGGYANIDSNPAALSRVQEINAELADVVTQIEQQMQSTPSSNVTSVSNPLPPTQDPVAERTNNISQQTDVNVNDGAINNIGTGAGAAKVAGNQVQDDGYDPYFSNGVSTIAPAEAQAADTVAGFEIQPRENVLDRFANYTYQASVYMLTPAQLKTFQNLGKKALSGSNLLFQSGGAPQGTTNRNAFFSEDFYIDNIHISNVLMGRGTNAAHGATELKFTVVEPNNITLIDRLYSAVQAAKPTVAPNNTGPVNYAAICYLMVIRFYGYNLDGTIQAVGSPPGDQGLTDPSSVVEKYIPFRIKGINWSISSSKLVNYEFDCAPIGQFVAGTTNRGSVPADVELTGATVGEVLGEGKKETTDTDSANPGTVTTTNQQTATPATAQSTPSTPPKAITGPNPASTGSLIDALNRFQQQLVKDKKAEVADEYVVEWLPGSEKIRDATLSKPGSVANKAALSMSKPPTQDPSASSPDKGAADTTTRNYGVTAGMQMLQVIELLVRNSNYILDQATQVIDETTQQPKPNPKSNTKGLDWFIIHMTAEQLGYDNIRNDFAYKIKYSISTYTPQDIISPYFPLPKFKGVHKRYPWWFTGENSQVLDYTADFNYLYTVTVTGSMPGNNALAEFRKKYTTSMRDLAFFNPQARSTESAQGADGKTNEIAASAAEYLYSPSNNAEAKITILGDPAWIQQGSSVTGISKDAYSKSAFAPDGSINFVTTDVLFEVVWQRPEDYNLATGLADPYSRTQRSFGNRQPIQSIIYRAIDVVSEFKQGRFTQVIRGVQYPFPNPNNSNAMNTAGAGQSTPGFAATDPRRLDIQTDDRSYDAAEAARLSNYGTNGARTPDATAAATVAQASGEFSDSESGANQDVGSYSTPQPTTSNGQTVMVADLSPAARLGTLTTTSGQQIGSSEA